MSSVRVSILLIVSLVIGASAATAADTVDATVSPDASPCPTTEPTLSASVETSETGSPAPSPDTGDQCLPASPPPAEHEVTIVAGDLWFDPDEVVISANGTTTITLIDQGFITHNVTVDGLDLLLVAPAGRSGTATVVDPAPGTYEFYCSISGHREAGMVGTLIVESPQTEPGED
jgi:plastocyanin